MLGVSFRHFAAAILLATLALPGCGDSRAYTESVDNLQQISIAILTYHDDNNKWPASLDDIRPLIGKEVHGSVIGKGKTFEALMTNPDTGDNPGYEYIRPSDEVTGVDTGAILLYQLRKGKRDDTLPVAYGDGGVREIPKPQ